MTSLLQRATQEMHQQLRMFQQVTEDEELDNIKKRLETIESLKKQFNDLAK